MFAEDLKPFFDTGDFAVSGVYSGTGATIKGILDASYDEAMGRLQSSRPLFTCATADVSAAAHGQTLTIGSTAYTIRGVEPDGTGITVLRLEKP